MRPHLTRWPRAARLGARLLTALLAAALLALAAGELTGWRLLRQPIAAALSRASGVPVTLGAPFSLKLLGSPRLQLGHVSWTAAPGVPVGHLLRADDLSLGWRWADAWRAARGEPLHIRSLRATRIDASLMRLADGRASWRFGAPPAAADDVDPTARPWPTIERLAVGQGQLRLIDEPTGTQAVIQVATPARGDGLDLRAAGRYRGTPVELDGRAGSALGWLEGTSTLQLAGHLGATRLRYDGRLGDVRGRRRFGGTLRLQGPSLATLGEAFGATLPRTPAFWLDGRLSHDGGRWHLAVTEFRTGASRLAGDFHFDTTARPRALRGELTGAVLRLSDLGPAVGTGGEGAAGARPPPGDRLLPERRFDLPSLAAMQADIRVDLQRLDFGRAAVGDWRGLKGRLRLHDAVLTLDDLRAQVAGGEVRGRSSLDARGDDARWRLDLRLDGLALERWLRGLQTEDPPADGPPAAVSGVLAAHAELQGRGESTAEILGSLQGRLQASLHDGRISHLLVEAAGLDLAQALGVAIRGDEALALRCARVAMVVDGGVATVQQAVADNRDSTLRASGHVDLRHEQLDLTARARPKDFSLLAIRAPLHVGGTLAAPQVSLDGGRLAGRAAAAVALGALAPAAALLPFVDPGDSPPDDPCRGD